MRVFDAIYKILAILKNSIDGYEAYKYTVFA